MQAMSCSTSNPRHAHEWTVFQDRKSEIPDDKILVPGVVDSTTNFGRTSRIVSQRVQRLLILSGQSVIAGSDCGFGTFAGYGADPDIAMPNWQARLKGRMSR